MTTLTEKRAAFRALHHGACFVLPNPWDIGSARYLQHLGFKALATTSAGVAFSLGLPDNAVSRDDMLAHVRTIVEATDLPVNADYEDGFADTPEGVAENVRLCIEAGVAGLSIEDATGDASDPLYDLDIAVARLSAARAAVDASGAAIVLTARAECHIVGHHTPLEESLRRLRAYAAAGADCLYAPGPHSAAEIRTIVEAVAPKPVNVLISAPIGLAVDDLATLGVQRISVGSALARAAWGGFQQAARAIAERGSFDGLAGAPPFAELNRFFRDDLARRPGSGRRRSH